MVRLLVLPADVDELADRLPHLPHLRGRHEDDRPDAFGRQRVLLRLPVPRLADLQVPPPPVLLQVHEPHPRGGHQPPRGEQLVGRRRVRPHRPPGRSRGCLLPLHRRLLQGDHPSQLLVHGGGVVAHRRLRAEVRVLLLLLLLLSHRDNLKVRASIFALRARISVARERVSSRCKLKARSVGNGIDWNAVVRRFLSDVSRSAAHSSSKHAANLGSEAGELT
mmetsp:Transcript_20608/g.50570  ORF Transcript_20608/g.50570 Transcript_20608/m.50570 type:complete len:221 (-) Transcript_20608:477-1139(-)